MMPGEERRMLKQMTITYKRRFFKIQYMQLILMIQKLLSLCLKQIRR